jgi:glycerate kinase
MRLKVLVVPDKFKGTLTAAAAANAIAKGWRRARPDDTVQLLPTSDGGDGFGEVISQLLEAKVQSVRTVDAAHRACVARWWWEPKRKTAIVETANVIGLAMLPPGKFHPFQLDTFGIGAVVRAAESKGARHLLIGIGGSATNDAGFGLARALGWEFLDRAGKPIRRWIQLGALREIRKPARRLRFREVVVAVDVQNPLLGRHGATRVYGPQKGLGPADFELAEGCLRRLVRVQTKAAGTRFANEPGAGAAGGLGFGLLAFLDARLEPGFELFARHARLKRRLNSADLVITGEGAIDRSTLMGKGVGQIAKDCRALNIPCIGLGGLVSLNAREKQLFTHTAALNDLTTAEQARTKPGYWLERLAEAVGGEVKSLNR